MTVKEAAIELIRKLPDDVTWHDIADTIHVLRTESQSIEWETIAFDGILHTRLQEHLNGMDAGVPAEQLFQQLRERRASHV